MDKTDNTEGVDISHEIQDLGHNAEVFYRDVLYSDGFNAGWHDTEVGIYDKRNIATLIPKEALALLEWLKKEESNLRKMAENEAKREVAHA